MKWNWAKHDEGGLVRHGLLLVVATFLGALCNAVLHMALGRLLPNAEYGAFIAMLGLIMVVATPMLALQNTLAHFVSHFVQENRASEIRPLFFHWAKIFTALTVVLITAAWLGRGKLAAVWQVSPGLIVLTFAVLAASLWMYLFLGLLQGRQWFVWLAWAPQAWGVVRLVLGVIFAYWISATAFAALAAQGFGVLSVLALCLLATLLMRLPRGAGHVRPAETYRYLGSAVVCLAGYAMLMNLDTTLAKLYFDEEVAGLFAKAATIARTAVFLPVPVAAALFPKVTSTGELTDVSWRLLLRGLAFSGLLIAAVVGVCLLWPALPWTILYGRWTAEDAAFAAQLTRGMVLAMCPLALAYLMLNFEMAQRRFRWCYALVPCSLFYVGGVALFHQHPLQIALLLGAMNLLAAVLLTTGIWTQRRRG